MAQANTENTTSVSRRGAFALIAAAPMGAVPIVAVSSYPLFGATPDPIFAAIETFMHVQDANNKACKEHDEAEEKFCNKYGSMAPDAFSKEAREGLATIDPRFANSSTETHEQIARCSPAFPPDVLAMMHRELDRQTAVYDETVKPLELAADNAMDAYGDALTRLLNTEPTTVVGIAAVLLYVRENTDLNDDIKDFLETIAKAASGLAGLRV
jgi:hypothetical protein